MVHAKSVCKESMEGWGESRANWQIDSGRCKRSDLIYSGQAWPQQQSFTTKILTYNSADGLEAGDIVWVKQRSSSRSTKKPQANQGRHFIWKESPGQEGKRAYPVRSVLMRQVVCTFQALKSRKMKTDGARLFIGVSELSVRPAKPSYTLYGNLETN